MNEPEVLTSDTFAGHVGERFELVAQEGGTVEAVLKRCDETRYGDHEEWVESVGRVPFTLLFVVPSGEFAPQQTFMVRHPELGELAIFLVPLGPSDDGMRYEAVFS